MKCLGVRYLVWWLYENARQSTLYVVVQMMAWARDGMTPSNQFTASLFLKFPRKIIALMFTWLYVFSIAFANVRSRMFRRKWKYLCLFIISVFVFFRTHIFAFVTINVHDFSVFLNLLYSNEWQIQNVCLILMQCLSHSFFLSFERSHDLSLSLSPSHMRFCNPLSHSIIITFSTIFYFCNFSHCSHSRACGVFLPSAICRDGNIELHMHASFLYMWLRWHIMPLLG